MVLDRTRTTVIDMVPLVLKGSPLATTLHSTILIEHRLVPLLATLLCVRLGSTQRIEFTVPLLLIAVCILPWDRCVTLKLAIPTALLDSNTTPRGPTLWRITFPLRVRRKVCKTRMVKRIVLP